MMIDTLRRRDITSSMHHFIHSFIHSFIHFLRVISGIRRDRCSEMQVGDVVFDLGALHKGEVALELHNCYVDDVLNYIRLCRAFS
jgi:hypothetical protein